MSKINVGGFSFGPTYPALEDALAVSKPGDTIVIKKNLTIDRTIYIDHDVIIDGNSSTISIADGTLGFSMLAGNITIANCSVIVGNHSNFIAKKTTNPVKLSLVKLEVGHNNLDASQFYPSIHSDKTKDGESNLNFSLEIINCGIDQLFTNNLDDLMITEKSNVGDPATNNSIVTAKNITINDSQISNIRLVSTQLQNIIRMHNVSTLGKLTVDGNLDLNGFFIDPLPTYRSAEQWSTLFKNFEQSNLVYALVIRGSANQTVNAHIDNVNLNAEALKAQQDIYSTSAWFHFIYANVTLINSHIPATIKHLNSASNCHIKLDNSTDAGRWKLENSTGFDGANNGNNNANHQQTNHSNQTAEQKNQSDQSRQPSEQQDNSQNHSTSNQNNNVHAQILLNGKNYPTLKEAFEASNSGDTININGQLLISEGVTIDHDITINGSIETFLSVGDNIAGLTVKDGHLSLTNLNIHVGNKSNLVVDREEKNETFITFKNVQIDHPNLVPEDFYPSFYVATNDEKKVNASLEIINSAIDKGYAFCKSVKINQNSHMGTAWCGSNYIRSSAFYADNMNIEDARLDMILLGNKGQDTPIKIKNVSTSSTINIISDVNIDGFSLLPLNVANQNVDQLADIKEAFDNYCQNQINGNITLILNGEDHPIKATIKNFSVVDLDVLNEHKQLINVIEWFSFYNSNVEFIDSTIPATPSNQNVNNIGTVTYKNSTDDSEWQVTENAYSQLDKIVGLKSVKKELELQVKNAKFNQKRIENGINVPRTAITMAFEGNSGTGKKTVAKVFSDILVQENVIQDNFVSVPSQLLMTENAFDNIQRSFNGILYVEDAEKLKDNESSILLLLQTMEQHPNDLNIILSGNEKKMEEMLSEVSPRFNSFFSKRIKFPDLSTDELIQILKMKLDPAKCTPEALEIVHAGLDRLRDANKLGDNANFIKTIIDNLSTYQSERLSQKSSQTNEELMTYEEADANNAMKKILIDNKMSSSDDDKGKDAVEELNQLIGLGSVKDQLRKFIDIASTNQLLKERGMSPQSTTMNMVFEGNPGTGKTVVARLFAKALFQHGVLKTDKLVEVKAKDLVSQYMGQTAKLTAKKINEAINGVLFIDEAYSLAPRPGSYNDEAVDELIADMENNRDRLVVIMAGYPHDMQEFFKKSNLGLESRFPNKINFPDYTEKELVDIFNLQLKHFTKDANGDYVAQKCTPEAQELVEDAIGKLYDSDKINGNARFIRDMVVGKIAGAHSERIASDSKQGKVSDEELNTFNEDDVRKAMSQVLDSLGVNNNYENNGQSDSDKNDQKKDEDAVEKLNSLIGLQSVKQEASRLINLAKMNEIKKANNLPVQSTSMNMVFEGNPGTGKTVVARLFAKALFQAGVLKTDKFVEAKAEDLIGQYTGQSAPKTKAVVMSALNGVLFIDEAYQLAPQPNGGGFNDEVVTELLTDIENNRDKLVVIMAGYTKEMEDFFKNGNPGLASRFPNRIVFPDYSPDELFEILQFDFKNKGLSCTEDALAILKVGISNYVQAVPVSGNGRFVRNLVEKMVGYQADRLQTLFAQLNGLQLTDEQRKQITTFNADDAVNALRDVQKDIDH